MSSSVLLFLRGMRWRLGTSLLTVLTSTIAVGAAVLGPLYLRTAGDSVVRTTVASASIQDRGATLSAPSGQTVSLGEIRNAEVAVQRAGAARQWYGTPLTTVISGVGLTGRGASPLRSQLLWRTGICNVLRFRSGGCDLAPGDVSLSDRTARELGASVDSIIDAGVQGTSRPLRLRVTGIYSVPNFNLSYWWGNAPEYFPYGQVTGGSVRIPEVDSLITSSATALAVPPQNAPEIVGRVPLRPAHIGLAQEQALLRNLAGVTAAVAAHGVLLSTRLPSLLAAADSQRHTMSTIVAITAVQLVLLAVWVLVGLLVRSSDARQSEMRVARLRGFPPATLLSVTALEPALLCLVGVGLGIAAAWGAVLVARDQLLDARATIAPDPWVFAALGLTLLAVVGALGLATVRLLRSSQLSEPRAAAPAASRRTSFAADAVLLVLAVVALIALATNGSLSGHSNPIASAAPGLIALGTAVIAVQLVLFACRLGVSASAYSDRVALFLALRQIVRRPAVMRQTRVLIIALCLACFAISAWSVARTNRAAAATFSVGTTEVVTVTPHGVRLDQAVGHVDPHGRFAMAAVSVATPSSTLLGVDAARLPSVGAWPHGISASSLAATRRLLSPPTAPEVRLPGAPVRLVATTTATRLGVAALRGIDVVLWVFNPQVGTAIVDLGSVQTGLATYQASLAGVCPGGCRLAGLGLIPVPNRNAPASGAVTLSLGRVLARSPSETWRTVAADLTARDWRATATGVRLAQSPSGVSLVAPASAIANYTGEVGFAIQPMASVADHPAVLPGAVTTEVQTLNGGAAAGGVVPGQGLDGNTLQIKSAVSASALPRVGGNAVMVDLALLTRSQTGPTSPYATDEVWLGPDAPADVLARLRAAGLGVDKVQTASAVFQQLERSAPALADDFLLAATIVALIAAAASTLGVLGATTRERATELTALEVGGIPRRSLAGALAVESSVLALTALFGAAAGVLAAVMAIPSLPELAMPGFIPLHYGLPGGLVAAVSAAVVAVVLLATGTVAAILIHRMSPLLLRTAPNDTTG